MVLQVADVTHSLQQPAGRQVQITYFMSWKDLSSVFFLLLSENRDSTSIILEYTNCGDLYSFKDDFCFHSWKVEVLLVEAFVSLYHALPEQQLQLE